MSLKTVNCPFCRTPKSVTRNMQYSCQNCGARITIDNDGDIKSAVPKKK